MSNLKSISELPITESSDGLNFIVNDNGNAKQIPVNFVVVENSGSVFVIDTSFSMNNTTHGNSVKDALLGGKTVYFYDGTFYYTVVAFRIQESTESSSRLMLFVSGSLSTTGELNFTPRMIPFAITL